MVPFIILPANAKERNATHPPTQIPPKPAPPDAPIPNMTPIPAGDSTTQPNPTPSHARPQENKHQNGKPPEPAPPMLPAHPKHPKHATPRAPGGSTKVPDQYHFPNNAPQFSLPFSLHLLLACVSGGLSRHTSPQQFPPGQQCV